MRVIPLDPALDSRCCEQCGAGLVRRKREQPKHWVARRFCSVACLGQSKAAKRAERFWGRVDKRSANECWPWRGPLTDRGYGQFATSDKNHRSHRLALSLSGVDVPDDLAVLHSCDNPPCCNPAHLSVGTWADNNRDMVAKGRHRNRYSK